MKKKKYDAYANYYYKYNKKGKIKTRVLAILFCLFAIATVIFFSISFSNFLIVGKIVNVNSNYIYSNKLLYGISLFSSNNLEDAKNYCDTVKQQGGAGYIYLHNKEYNVLSSVYPSLNDANKVISNLQTNGITSKSITIELPAINIKATLSEKSRKCLNESISIFYDNYTKIYNLSLEYDKQNIDILKLKNLTDELYSENSNTIKNFNNYFNQSANTYILYVKIYLTKLNQIIKEFQTLDDSNNISSFIKEIYCKVVMCYMNLFNEMV